MQASPRLEDQIRILADRLDRVEERLSRLEGPGETEAPSVEPLPPSPVAGAPTGSGAPFDLRHWTTSLGRAFIVLGGAFLLRAMTDAAVWAPAVGVLLGLTYALLWLASSDRAAVRGDRVRALFDGGTSLVIGFPLLVEASTRFRLLGADGSAAALAVFSAAALVTAWRSNLRPLAWLATLGGMFTGLTLMVRLGVVAPYALYFTGLGVGALWVSYLRLWRGLRWPTGFLAAAGVLGVTSRAISDPPADSASTAWFVQAVLVAAYFSSIAVRTLVRGRQLLVFEIVQTALILAVSVGGAFAVSGAAGAGGTVLGLALVVLGVAAYLVSFPFLPRESRGGINFYFYSTLALVFVVTGLQTALAGAPRAVALLVLALLLAGMWTRSGRVSLGGHLAVALLAASLASGLLSLAQGAFVGEPPLASSLVLLTLAVALGISATSSARADEARLRMQDVPTLVIGLIGVTGAAGALTLLAAAILRQSGLTVDAGVLATIRTAVLSLVALGCAQLDRPGRGSSLGKLAYPILAATGLKLAFSDLRASTPSTLFVALACYGAALVLVTRLRRGSEADERRETLEPRER